MFKETLRRVTKSVSKNVTKLSDYIAVIGPSKLKSFRQALLDMNEEEALALYLSIDKGKSLQLEMHPSQPFSLRLYSDNTPFHLASTAAMIKLILLFLEKEGNPSIKNVSLETSLHAVCSRKESADDRARLCGILLEWKGIYDGVEECVSVNSVDREGRSAIHNAAMNGLTDCLELLINHGAIISLVNKDNKTCCDIADDNSYKSLADMLELGLVYQPQEEFMREYNNRNNTIEMGHSPLYILDALVLDRASIDMFIHLSISEISEYLSVQPTIAEVLLAGNEWDTTTMKSNYKLNVRTIYENAQLEPPINLTNISINNSKGVVENVVDNMKNMLTPITNMISTTVTAINESINASITNIDNNTTTFIESNTTVNEEDNSDIGVNDIIKSGGSQDTEINLDNIKLDTTTTTDEDTSLTIVHTCTICGDTMSPSISYEELTNGSIEVLPTMLLSASCSHSFCLSCWQQNFCMEVTEGRGEVIKCPEKQCLQRQEYVINHCSLIHRCPSNNCGHILLASDTAYRKTSKIKLTTPQSIICPNGHAMCLLCTNEGHAPCNCVLAECWNKRIEVELAKSGIKHDANGEEIASALWMAANTKACPRCSSVIEKDEGCNHMNCRNCRHEFCWICMQNWNLHSSRTGGFFQCNRFNQDGSTDNMTSNGTDNMRPTDFRHRLHALESGNAHMEAIRQREQATRVARYIHFYSRYKAHWDSLILETKMSIETINRLELTLSRSIHTKNNEIVLNDEEYVANYMLMKGDCTSSSTEEIMPLKWLATSTSFTTTLNNDINSSIVDMEEDKNNGYVFNIPSLKETISSTDSIEKVSLDFLRFGFEELIKCRHFLKNSFSYAFYVFGDRAEFDNEFLNKNKRFVEKYLGSQTHNRKEEFERLQTEVESITELLSNLVARKRLRASKSQIIIATRGARMKRIEFEEMLNVWAIQDEEEQYIDLNMSSNKRSNNGIKPSTIMNRFRWNGNNNNVNYHRTNSGHYDVAPTHNVTQSNLSAREISRNRRMRNTGQYLESSPLSNPASQFEDTSPGSDFSRMLAALNSVLDDTPRPLNNANNTRVDETDGNIEGNIDTTNTQNREVQREVMDADEELFLAFRLEEEEQINRAILESLQESNGLTQQQNNHVNSHEAVGLNVSSDSMDSSLIGNIGSSNNLMMNDTNNSDLNTNVVNDDTADNVAVLVGLGFSHERVVAVLELCRGNIDEAAMYLIENA